MIAKASVQRGQLPAAKVIGRRLYVAPEAIDRLLVPRRLNEG